MKDPLLNVAKTYLDLTEGKGDYKKIAADFEKADDKKRKSLAKKHDLLPIVSRLRPGEIKLGVKNELEMNPKKVVIGLDADGELIAVTGNPPKIYDAAALKQGKL